MNRNRFSVLFVAVYSQKKISDEAGEDLNHQAILASGKQVIHFKVPFPPCKKTFNVPAEFIYRGGVRVEYI